MVLVGAMPGVFKAVKRARTAVAEREQTFKLKKKAPTSEKKQCNNSHFHSNKQICTICVKIKCKIDAAAAGE